MRSLVRPGYIGRYRPRRRLATSGCSDGSGFSSALYTYVGLCTPFEPSPWTKYQFHSAFAMGLVPWSSTAVLNDGYVRYVPEYCSDQPGENLVSVSLSPTAY